MEGAEMFNQEFIRELKQSNISKDSEKTKVNVKTVWQTLNSEQKKEVLALADVTVAAVYRVFRTGVVSAKLVIPISMTADVDPYYLTGQSDSTGKFSEELAIRLLSDLGYSKILDEYRHNTKATRRKKSQSELEVKENTKVVEPPEGVDNSEANSGSAQPAKLSEDESVAADMNLSDVATDLSEEDILLLLKALLLRARLNIAGTKERFDKIKDILLS